LLRENLRNYKTKELALAFATHLCSLACASDHDLQEMRTH